MSQAGKVVGTAARKDKVEKIRPTLFIGLGGTGREVLLRVRQRFVERYGVSRFPAMAHLWIDTDVDDPEGVTGKPKDFLTAESRLHQSEMLDATINADQFLSYFENSQQNGHIFSWIYPGVRKSGSVLHGARAVRPLGRLAFFHHSARIRRRILEAVAHISDARRRDEMRDKHGIELETDSIHAVIVYSVAGGTGSGMFLDTAFLLRHLARQGEIPAVNTIGYLVLPSVFAPPSAENERFYANAYAALKELEHFSARKDQRHDPVGEEDRLADRVREVSAHDFVANWERQERPAVVVGPPFNSCFLVGNAPAGGQPVPPENKGDVFDMVAESVFVDFSRQRFAEQKRSMRSNLEDYLKNDLEYSYRDGDDDVYKEVFSFRYSTFGLSKLHVPIDRIRRACGYRLGVDLVDRWLAVHEPQGDLRGYLEEHETEPLGVRVGGGRDDLRPRLDRMNDAGQTLPQAVRHHWETTKLAEFRTQVRVEKPGLKPALADEFVRYQKQFFNKPDDEQRWGSFVRRLHAMGKELRKELQERMQERIHAWLNEERVRLALGVEFLKTLHQILAEAEEKYRKAAAGQRQRMEGARRDWDAFLAVIDEEETDGPWVRRWPLRALVEEACGIAARHFEHAGLAEMYAVGADVLADLQRHVGSERVEVDSRGEERTVRSGQVQRLFTLREQLAELRGELARRLDAFDRAENHLVFTNLYRAGMFRRFYELVRPDGSTEPVGPTALRDLETQLRDHLEVVSPYDLHDRMRREGSAAVREAMEEFTRRPFQRMQGTNADAVALLYGLVEAGELKEEKVAEAISRLVENGNAWLRTNHRAQQSGSELLKNYAVAALLGIDRDQRGNKRYQDFEEDVVSRASKLEMLKSTPVVAVDTDPDAVFFYTELAGLPLACLENIDNYRQAYRRKIEEFLHLDRHTDRFTDVALKDQEEVRLAVRVTRAVLLGVILRVLEVTGKGSEAVLHYVDTRNFPPHRRHVGTRLDALELLSADPDLLAAIERGIEDRIRGLDVQRTEQFFTLLSWHVLDGNTMGTTEVGPFAPRDVRVGEATAHKLPIEYRAVQLSLRRIESSLADRGVGSADGDLNRTRLRIFEKWYPRRTEFGMEVQLGIDTLLAFRDEPTGPVSIPVHDALGGVFEQDYA